MIRDTSSDGTVFIRSRAQSKLTDGLSALESKAEQSSVKEHAIMLRSGDILVQIPYDGTTDERLQSVLMRSIRASSFKFFHTRRGR